MQLSVSSIQRFDCGARFNRARLMPVSALTPGSQKVFSNFWPPEMGSLCSKKPFKKRIYIYIYWTIAIFTLMFIHPHLYFVYLVFGSFFMFHLVDLRGWLAATVRLLRLLQAWFARTFGQLLPCHLHEGTGVSKGTQYQQLMLRYRCIDPFKSWYHLKNMLL